MEIPEILFIEKLIEEAKQKIFFFIESFQLQPAKSLFLFLLGIFILYLALKNYSFLFSFFLSIITMIFAYHQEYFTLTKIPPHLFIFLIGISVFILAPFIGQFLKSFFGYKMKIGKNLLQIPKNLLLFPVFLFLTWFILLFIHYNLAIYELKLTHYTLTNRVKFDKLAEPNILPLSKFLRYIPTEQRSEIFFLGNQANLNLSKILFIEKIDSTLLYKKTSLSEGKMNQIREFSQTLVISSLIEKVKYGAILRHSLLNRFLQENPILRSSLLQETISLD